MQAEHDPVVLDRRPLALHHVLEVPQVALSDLIESQPLGACGHDRLHHQLAEPGLSLSAREPVSRPGPPARPELSHHLTAVDPPLPIPSRAPSRARCEPRRAMAAGGEGRGGDRRSAGAGAAGVLAATRGDRGGARAARLLRPGRSADGGPCHPPGQGSRCERRAARARVAITCRAPGSRRSSNRAAHLPPTVGRGARLGRAYATTSRVRRPHPRPLELRAPRRAAGAQLCGRPGRAGPRDHGRGEVVRPRSERGALARRPRERRRSAVLDARAPRAGTRRHGSRHRAAGRRPRARGRGRDGARASRATVPVRRATRDGAPPHARRRRGRRGRRSRGHGQDDRTGRRSRRLAAVRRARARLCAQPPRRPGARARGRGAVDERRRDPSRASAARAEAPC